MIYIFEDIDKNATIVFEGNLLTDAEKERAIAIETLPVKNVPDGKISVLKADKETESVWYEYVDSPETEIATLRADMNEAIMELSMIIAMGGLE